MSLAEFTIQRWRGSSCKNCSRQSGHDRGWGNLAKLLWRAHNLSSYSRHRLQTFLLCRLSSGVITRPAHEGDKVSGHCEGNSCRGNTIHRCSPSGYADGPAGNDSSSRRKIASLVRSAQLTGAGRRCDGNSCRTQLHRPIIAVPSPVSSRTDRSGGVGKFTQNRTVSKVSLAIPRTMRVTPVKLSELNTARGMETSQQPCLLPIGCYRFAACRTSGRIRW
jgi:hypothetical protein